MKFGGEILGKFAAARKADFLAGLLPARSAFGAITKIDAGAEKRDNAPAQECVHNKAALRFKLLELDLSRHRPGSRA